MGACAQDWMAMAKVEARQPRRFVDFASVPGHQWDMHQRLLNWATASRDIPMSMQVKCAPGFDLYRSSDARREYGAETLTVVDQRDAQRVQAGVRALEESKHRPAIQWYYLKNGRNPAGQATHLRLTLQELADVVRQARQSLIDRLV